MMRFFKSKGKISFPFVLVLIFFLSTPVSARECNPFPLDPADPTACDGAGDPDGTPGPLDSGVPILVIAGIAIGLLKIKKYTN